MEPAIFSATSPRRSVLIFGDFRWKCGAGPVGGVLRSRGGESLEPNKSAHKKDSAQNDRLWAGRFNQPQDLSLIHISEPTRRTPISYAVFCLKKKKKKI